MRLFIAFDACEELKENIVCLQKKLPATNNISLVPKENMHITLKFLGDVKDSKEIESKLEKVSFEKFELKNAGLGFFPDEKFIRVFWVGFDESKELEKLHEQIEFVLKDRFKNDFDFVAHMTIARVKYILPEEKKVILKLKEDKIASSTTNVSSFKLMKSNASEKGFIYEVVREFAAKDL